MSGEEKNRLIDNIAGQLACVSRNDVVERSISYFRKADADYGERIEKAAKTLRSKKA
jgi:catalase